MPYFYDPITKRKSEISSPELNPELIKGKTQIPGTEIITSEDLNSVNKIDFFLPMEVSAYPVAGLNTQTGQAEILPKEQEQSDIIKRTQALIDQFTGKETFKAEKEIELGIPEFKKTQQDLASRLKIIQAEAQAIPLQLQQEAKGRGITTGGLAPIEAGRLRANAIQALSVSSLLEASRGNLTTALDLADRAVAQKYNPIEAQINANLQNLELLSKDPTLTLAQKNRLEAQQRIQEQRKVKIELTKKNEEEARKKVLNYAGIADALTLNEMSKAKTALEVAKIAERKGLKTLEQQKKEAEIMKIQRPSETDIKTETFDKIKLEAAQIFEIDRKRNEDKMITPDLYLEMRQRTPATFRDDFDKAFQHLLSEESKAKFGIEFKKEITIQSVLDKTKKTFQQYKDANYSREDVESQYKAENKLEEISEPVKKIIDEVFGEKKSWWQW